MQRTSGVIVSLFLLLLVTHLNSYSFSVVKPSMEGNNISNPKPDYVLASVFVNLTPKEFRSVAGKKLNLPERIYFKIVQRRLKRELKKNPDLLITAYYDPEKAKFKFDLLWFVIAAFIGPFGVLAAYTTKPRKGGPTKKNKITSAWLGFIFFFLWFGYLFIY